MSPWQAAREIQCLLLKRVWPDSPGNHVFANVFVSQGPAEDTAFSSMTFPAALVRVLDATADADNQVHQTQRFEVLVMVKHTGDQFGEAAMVGGNRPSQGGSGGRGLLEVEEQVMQALQFLDPTSAFRLQMTSAGAAEAAFLSDVGYLVHRPLTFQARLTTTRVYPTPNAGRKLRSSVAGGNVTLTWTWHERFDLRAAGASRQLATARGALTLVRKAGSSAPTSVTDGTVVPLASNAAVTVTDAPGSGTWSYALFAQYDEFGDGTGSAPMTGTSIRTSTAATVTGIVV